MDLNAYGLPALNTPSRECPHCMSAQLSDPSLMNPGSNSASQAFTHHRHLKLKHASGILARMVP